MKYLLIFTLILSFNLQASETETFSIEIPEELAQEITDHSNEFFGEYESFTFSLVTENDNFGHGLGGVLGLKAVSSFEGDDLGKSFAINADLLWKYKNAELAVSFFSDLYSRFGFRVNSDGILSERSENDETYTENLGYEGVRAKITKDVNNKTFLSFEVEVAREDDKNTIAIYIQDFFHTATKSWDNAQGGKQVQYEYLDHIDPRFILTNSVTAGKRFTLYQSKKLKLHNTSELGLRLSTESNFSAAFAKTSFDLKLGKNNLKLYGEYDTNENYIYGALLERVVLKRSDFQLSMALGASKEDTYYNDLFPDLYDHRVGSRELSNGGDILYQYTFKLKFK